MILNIVIPVYNAERTLGRLLDSILSQSKKNKHISLKVITVDDGSEDGSENVILKYCSKFDFFHHIKQKNSGVYIARNKALDFVDEGFVWFIDSDDLLSENALSTIANVYSLKGDEVEIFHFGYRVYSKSFEDSSWSAFLPENSLVNGLDFLDNNDGRLYLWNNIYNVKFIKSNSLSFLGKSKSLEDSLFNIIAFSKARRVYCNDSAIYYYMDNPKSISRTKTKKSLDKFVHSTQNVHGALLKLIDITDSIKAKKILKSKLDLSILGFFYSLYLLPYDYEFVKEMYSRYESQNLIPVRGDGVNLKARIFSKFINFRPFFHLLFYTRKFFL